MSRCRVLFQEQWEVKTSFVITNCIEGITVIPHSLIGILAPIGIGSCVTITVLFIDRLLDFVAIWT